jgi:hypothetical protein
MPIWYIDNRITPGQESDSFNGGFGVGFLRDAWSDVTWTAGDFYYGACGATFAGGITVGASGTAAAPITMAAYGDESLGWPLVTNAGGTGLLAAGRDWLRVRKWRASGCSSHGMNLRGANCIFEDLECFSNGGSGVTFNLATNWTDTVFRRVRAHNNVDHAIGAAANTGTSAVRRVWFIDCEGVGSTGTGKHGLYMEYLTGATGSVFEDVQVVGGVFSRNTGAGINLRHTVDAYPGASSAFNRNVNIRSTTTHDNGSAGISVIGIRGGVIANNDVRRNGTVSTLGGIWTGRNIGLVVSSNEVHDNTTPGIDGAGVFDDQYNVGCIVRGNHITGHRGSAAQPYYSGFGIASYSAAGSRIHGNFVARNVHGIWISNPTATPLTNDVEVTNNTFVDNTTSGINYDFDLGNNRVNARQNIVTGSPHGIYKPGTLNTMLESGNYAWGNGINFSGITPGAGSSQTDYSAWLQRNGQLVPAAGANPLENAGTYLPGVHLMNGRMRPGFCPVGAYQAVLPRQARSA